MVKMIKDAVEETMCDVCRDGDIQVAGETGRKCPFPTGCEEYRSTIQSAEAAVLAVLRCIFNAPIWSMLGILRDCIAELNAKLAGKNYGNKYD